MPSLEQQFQAHERADAARFAALDEKIDNLPTKEDMKPIIEAWQTLRSGRNGILWVAVTLITIGGAISVIKGLFK
jgi:hypothetical protein